MRTLMPCLIGTLGLVVVLSVPADEATESSVRNDRKQIAGVWRVTTLEVSGQRADDADARKLTVINDADGGWKLLSEGREVCQGTNQFAFVNQMRTIDFTATTGDIAGQKFVGIYELGDQTRKLCFGPADRPRPARFTTTAGSDTIYLTLTRDPDDALRRERQRIAGTWQIKSIELDGKTLPDDDVKSAQVINGADGTWRLVSAGMEVARGTSTFDPGQKVKTIDFTITAGNGEGNRYVGIYELGDSSRRLCFAEQGRERPTAFSATADSQQILVTFERVKTP
ncbi:MAG: TIGR03067 domain-containing protein [Planctomycetes bacterium]|nr:TIGR03067 domain-containing protein [Planctomycetota bacterium]